MLPRNSMCGRYSLDAKPREIVEAFALAEAIAFASRYNIAPTQDIPVVRADRQTSERRMELVRWGLTPAWWHEPRPIINARSETIGKKFQRAFSHRRCLVPATGFYEWQKLGGAKQPFHIQQRNRGLFAFAGIWDRYRDADGEPIEACAILTTRPNRIMAPLHNRMPVILAPETYVRWLDPGHDPESDLQELLVPPPDDLLDAYPVSRRVNTTANDDAACVQPLAETESRTRDEDLWESR